MKYNIIDDDSGLYIGSHSLPGYKLTPFFKLQILDKAVVFDDLEEAQVSFKFLSSFADHLRIVKV